MIFNIIWLIIFLVYLSVDDFLSSNTVSILILFHFFFLVFALLFISLYKKKKEMIYRAEVTTTKSIILVFIQSLSVCAALAYINAALNANGIGLIAAYSGDVSIRDIIAFNDYSVPIWAKLLNQLNYLNLLLPIAFVIYKRDSLIFLCIALLLSTLYNIIFMQRSGVLLILVVVLFTYLRVNDVRFSTVIKVVVPSFLFFILVSVFILFSRGIGLEGVWRNFSDYLLGGISGFQAFYDGYSGTVFNVAEKSSTIGLKEFSIESVDFMGNHIPFVYGFLMKLGFIEQQFSSNHDVFVYSPVATNIYTWYKAFLLDFWYFGVVLFPFIYCFLVYLVMRFFYYKLSVFSIFLCSYVFYMFFRSFGGIAFDLKTIVMTFLLSLAMSKFINERADER
ncbi:O-antigen polymerase [Vibrio sp. F13]|uniref:O-antigen polymerase n=1 Tax=Vibrio sp. F13 TaxID=2070777 RepID=UPI001F10283B|nr:O-antigen polymerase [Vibrio sp. F13]